MTRDAYESLITAWCVDVKAEALRLFESGVLEIECTGLAINIVESRRRKTQAALQRFAPQQPTRN